MSDGAFYGAYIPPEPPVNVADPVAAAYRLKLGELREVLSAGLERARKRLVAAAPDQRLIVATDAEESIQVDTIAAARKAVAALALVHVRETRAPVSEITARIRTQYLDVGLKNVTSLCTSIQGIENFSAEGARLRQPALARFENQRSALRREVEDIVITTLAELPRKNLRERLDAWWKKSLVGGIVATVLFLSTLVATGFTLFGLFRTWVRSSGPPAITAPRVGHVAPKGSAITSQIVDGDAGIRESTIKESR